MKVLLLMGLLLAGVGFATAGSRPPAVSGAFYSDDPQALRAQVERLLAAGVPAPGPVRAIVVPHAGFVYSGATAARAFAGLATAPPRRVILLGPSHHAAFEGGALPDRSITAFATPLGEVALDRDVIERLRADRDFQGPARAHDPEHCLEVELPFLQVVAPEARIVPVLVGHDTDDATSLRMARTLAGLLDPDTAIVVSSDFTHHGSRYGYAPFAGRRDLPEALLALGRSTAGRLAAVDADGFRLQVEVSQDTVCGRRPLVVLCDLLEHAFAGTGSVLDVTTSGAVSGSYDLSVTYAAIAFEGAWTSWSEAPMPALGELDPAARRALLELARATLRSHLSHDGSLADWFAAHGGGDAWRAPAGAFVTVHNTGKRALAEGRLRACMGVIEAREPLVDAITSAAVSAAHDPRFPPLALDELGEVELEISVLSPTHRVAGPADIEVGKHGVVLSKGGLRAVFLPQVAVEQGWDVETMLSQLARKAGLPRDGWRSGATFEVFTAQVFSEER